MQDLKYHLEKWHKDLFQLYKSKQNSLNGEPLAKKLRLDENVQPKLVLVL